ncbi:spore coat U domain-containing protein [Massilia sp. 9096]|uniref:Csu type fimbrial protein n=1 Tax=Massilia sp. 9096 TaxID=1500894 RepID=UPI00055D6017|nr:spore coat U domain-containing protein [Massilia sp. 9096]
MIRRILMLAGLCWLLFGCQPARADDCSAAATDVVFGAVSPIAGSDYYASGTITVTCYWNFSGGTLLGTSAVLLPNATVCINLGLGSPTSGGARAMGYGGAVLSYELYRDSTYAAGSVWGGGAGMPTSAKPVTTTFTALLALSVQTATFPVYARIPAAALTGLKPSGAGTPYTASFAGSGSISYNFSTLVGAGCSGGKTASFSFQVTANVINDCQITAGSLVFGSKGILSGAARASSTLSAKCSAGTTYQVALSGGTVGSLALGRKMKNAATGETIAYSLSRTLDGPVWGDGVSASASDVLSGIGTGVVQSMTVYGLVPKQNTPSPGDYQDRVTATIVF